MKLLDTGEINLPFRVYRLLYSYSMNRKKIADKLGVANEASLSKRLCNRGKSFKAMQTEVRIRLLDKAMREGKSKEWILCELEIRNEKCLDIWVRQNTGMTLIKYRKEYELREAA